MDLASEPLASELASRCLVPQELIYNTATCFVYKVFDHKINQTAVLKLVLQLFTANPEHAEREVRNQMNCAHPNVVRVYDYFWFTLAEQYWVSALVMELMSMDLMKVVENRRKNKYPWTDAELFEFLKVMVDVLAGLQEQRIAHRDIKPQNIFFHQNTYKIGDFGSSREVSFNPEYLTRVGTPSYMSPELRSQSTTAIVYNPFKSDVFSLGLTVLTMAQLTPLSPFGDISTIIEPAIASLQYSEGLKDYIRWMLQIDVNSRPDFIAIRDYINPTETELAVGRWEEVALMVDTGVETVVERSPQSSEIESPLKRWNSKESGPKKCQHLIQNQELHNLKMMCGHELCKDCAIPTNESIHNCIRLDCPLCKQTWEYQMLYPISYRRENSGEKIRCKRCELEYFQLVEIVNKDLALCQNCFNAEKEAHPEIITEFFKDCNSLRIR